MALDKDAEEIIRFLNHDETEIWWPDATGQDRYRGCHIQEILDYAVSIKKVLVCVEYNPIQANNIHQEPKETYPSPVDRFWELLMMLRAPTILILEAHAVAWDPVTLKIFDPIGLLYYPTTDLKIREAWVIKSN